MDQVVAFLRENLVFLVVGYLLFRGKIDPLLTRKPAPPVAPLPVPIPVAPVVDEKPILDVLLKLLPLVLPQVLAQQKKD